MEHRVQLTNKVQFKIEFENAIPTEFKERPNIKGWQILSA